MMMDKNGLSIIAMFDEISRNRTVLTAGIETEFSAFVMSQEDCRKKWMQAERAVLEMMERLKKIEEEKNSLETKLKHARDQIDVEYAKRRKAEKTRDEYEKQIMLVKELLTNKNNSTMLNDHARETLAFLSTDFRSHQKMEIEDTTSDQVSPEISFDRTDDDLDRTARKKSKKRPSAPQFEDEENVPPPQERNNERSAKRHRRSKSVDLELSIIGGPAMTVFEETSTPRKNRRKSSPFAVLIRSNSQGIQGEGIDGCSPNMKRMNSGNSLTRPHYFQIVSQFKQELCYVCNKKPKFASNVAKCKDCKVICHVHCKDLAPLPCMVTVNTPKAVKVAPGFIADYAPEERPFVPAIVIHCINEVELRGMKQEGIYRISGSKKEVEELKEKFLKGKTAPNLSAISDINVISSCLMSFLRTLKESLVTFALWQSFLEAAEKRDVEESTADLCQVISKLPLANRDTMAFLILHLLRVAENVECKMTISNLVKIFAPTIIGYSVPNPSSNLMMEQTGKQQQIMAKLITLPSDYWSAFIKSPEVYSTFQYQTPSSVGQYRILSKYEQISTPRSTLKPLNPTSTPSLHEGTRFQNLLGSNYSSQYLKKTTQFFAPPMLK